MSDAAANMPTGQWTTTIVDCAKDPAIALLGYCVPCILYGSYAEKVHGPSGSMVNHCLKFYLYSCICACGLVTGPTRRAIRDAYNLPVEPQFLEGDKDTADCLTGTIPCVNCLALCQDAREVENRKVTTPLLPVDPFNWAPLPAPTTAPAQQEGMAK